MTNLVLASSSLLSKWGFEDGAMPDHVADLIEESGIRHEDVPWQEVLRHLVRTFLLPEIQKHHTIELLDLGTIHNPIRATVVDGQDVKDEWYVGPVTQLKPECVEVPLVDVLAAIREQL